MHVSYGAEPKWVHHGVLGQKRVHGRKRVHGFIEKERAELTTHSACVTWDGAKVRVSKKFTVRKEFMVRKEFRVQ